MIRKNALAAKRRNRKPSTEVPSMLMAPIRILVVDDSVVTRRVLSDTLSGDPALEVVGTASDGRIALAKIPLLKPDLITLDVEMPVMDGLETLAVIRKLYPQLPVIMFSALTERGAAATLDALALGASDYATKPSNTASRRMPSSAFASNSFPRSRRCAGSLRRKSHRLPPPRSGIEGSRSRHPAHRSCGDRRIDRRSERPGRGLAEDSQRLSRPDCGGAAHAADFYPPTGRAAFCPLRHSRGRG